MVAEALKNVQEIEKKDAEKDKQQAEKQKLESLKQAVKKQAETTKKETEKDLPQKKEETKQPSKETPTGKVAVILLRGFIGVTRSVKETLFMLKLRQKHSCVVIDNTPSTKGMLIKCKDYITFGEISPDTLKDLQAKRGKKDAKGALKPFYRLHPPRGGFKGKGIKKTFKEGGSLGYRGEKMNELIRRML
ncbi:hypothetical protein CMO92_04065 [Candidatus Woesearchaeota archaeon]|nr:hypothetical protein [Candidatus Woesearchaeota archaeon]